jgi:metal-dependent amidase/aminoacylase/carboxypeptidase family protein
VQLQTIVSRQEDPRDPAIVTIGDIHGGTKRNIIPNEVKMEITARAYSDKSRDVIDEDPGTASEDFGIFGLEGRKIPTVMFGLGAMDPVKFAAAQAEGRLLPGPHNSRFEPVPEPTLRTGVKAMISVAIALLQK